MRFYLRDDGPPAGHTQGTGARRWSDRIDTVSKHGETASTDQPVGVSLPTVVRAGVAEASSGPGGPRWISHCRHASAVSGGE